MFEQPVNLEVNLWKTDVFWVFLCVLFGEGVGK